jgi:hypothetical protein
MRVPRLRAAVFAGLAATLLAGGACRAQSGRASPQECAPVATELPASSTSDALAGEYQLRLVATSGRMSGSVVQGRLKLQPQLDSLRYLRRPGAATDSAVRHPFYGSAEVDLTAVDAVLVGSTSSLDPMKPGVLVVEQRERAGQAPRAEIMIRLGSEANRRDRQRVDGGYTALRVRRVSAEGFAGTWGSGIVGERAAGYFCATRR